jgi:hypothetical protein
MRVPNPSRTLYTGRSARGVPNPSCTPYTGRSAPPLRFERVLPRCFVQLSDLPTEFRVPAQPSACRRRFLVYTDSGSISRPQLKGYQGSMLFKRSHRAEFRLVALAAVALFIAQLGAIAHAYTHRPSTAQTSAYQQTQASHELCGDCLNFAPLLAPAGTLATLPFSLQHSQGTPPPAGPASFLDHRTYLAFRSRAPPVTR